jgi:hypothetical protein
MQLMRISTAVLAFAAAAGCAQRDETYSDTVAPHAEHDGVVLTLLGVNENQGSLSAQVRVANSTDRELVLPVNHLRAQWIKAVWGDHAAQGTPHVGVVSGDADWPNEVPVDSQIVLGPFSSRTFDVTFNFNPRLQSTAESCALVLKGAFADSTSPEEVTLALPKPEPHAMPATPWNGG